MFICVPEVQSIFLFFYCNCIAQKIKISSTLNCTKNAPQLIMSSNSQLSIASRYPLGLHRTVCFEEKKHVIFFIHIIMLFYGLPAHNIRAHVFQPYHMIISYKSPIYSQCKSNWKWQISKTIAVPKVPDMSKESLEFRDES